MMANGGKRGSDPHVENDPQMPRTWKTIQADNIHVPFAQEPFADEGKSFWGAGDWVLPLGATSGEREGQATLQLPEAFPVASRAQ